MPVGQQSFVKRLRGHRSGRYNKQPGKYFYSSNNCSNGKILSQKINKIKKIAPKAVFGTKVGLATRTNSTGYV